MNPLQSIDEILSIWTKRTPKGGERGYFVVAVERTADGKVTADVALNAKARLLASGLSICIQEEEHMKTIITEALFNATKEG